MGTKKSPGGNQGANPRAAGDGVCVATQDTRPAPLSQEFSEALFVPADLARKLPAGPAILWALLEHRMIEGADVGFVDFGRLAEVLPWHRGTVYAWRAELERAGRLDWDEQPGRRGTAAYVLAARGGALHTRNGQAHRGSYWRVPLSLLQHPARLSPQAMLLAAWLRRETLRRFRWTVAGRTLGLSPWRLRSARRTLVPLCLSVGGQCARHGPQTPIDGRPGPNLSPKPPIPPRDPSPEAGIAPVPNTPEAHIEAAGGMPGANLSPNCATQAERATPVAGLTQPVAELTQPVAELTADPFSSCLAVSSAEQNPPERPPAADSEAPPADTATAVGFSDTGQGNGNGDDLRARAVAQAKRELAQGKQIVNFGAYVAAIEERLRSERAKEHKRQVRQSRQDAENEAQQQQQREKLKRAKADVAAGERPPGFFADKMAEMRGRRKPAEKPDVEISAPENESPEPEPAEETDPELEALERKRKRLAKADEERRAAWRAGKWPPKDWRRNWPPQHVQSMERELERFAA